jgi:hypothetical protein
MRRSISIDLSYSEIIFHCSMRALYIADALYHAIARMALPFSSQIRCCSAVIAFPNATSGPVKNDSGGNPSFTLSNLAATARQSPCRQSRIAHPR